MGAGEPESIRRYVAQLREGDVHGRASAATVLGDMGAMEAVPALIDALQADEDEQVREWAARSLGKLGGPLAIPALRGVVRLRAVTARRAADALGQLGEPALHALLSASEDEDFWVRAMVAFALRSIREPRSVATLLRYLDDPDGVVRREAVRWLADLHVRDAIGPIAAKLTDPYWEARDAAADALALFAEKGVLDPALLAQVTAILLGLVTAEDPLTRQSAAYALGMLGSAQAIGPLVQALADREAIVRRSAASALGTLGNAQAVGPLIRALADRDPSVLASTISALGDLRAVPAIPQLIDLLGAPHNAQLVQIVAAQALARMGHEALEPLVRLTNSDSPDARYWAAVALGDLGLPGALPALAACAADDRGRAAAEDRARTAAANAIRQIEDQGKDDTDEVGA